MLIRQFNDRHYRNKGVAFANPPLPGISVGTGRE
jgi:hypothetical protein